MHGIERKAEKLGTTSFWCTWKVGPSFVGVTDFAKVRAHLRFAPMGW